MANKCSSRTPLFIRGVTGAKSHLTYELIERKIRTGVKSSLYTGTTHTTLMYT